MSKSKDWWPRNQDNVSVIGAIYLRADCCFSQHVL